MTVVICLYKAVIQASSPLQNHYFSSTTLIPSTTSEKSSFSFFQARGNSGQYVSMSGEVAGLNVAVQLMIQFRFAFLVLEFFFGEFMAQFEW